MAEQPLLTKNAYVYDVVRRRILLGELPPGEPIPQVRIAAELGVSTTPLREALRRLESEGLVEIVAHKDVRPTALTADDARNLYEARLALDPEAARLAATRRTADELALIQDAARALRPLSDPGDLDAIMDHRAFHRAIYRASHNPVMTSLLDGLWDRADRYRRIGMVTRGEQDLARVHDEHLALAAAVSDGDGERAQDVMRAHVLGSTGQRAIEALG